MNFKYMVICGEDVTAAVFTDKTGTEMVRFQVEGTWHGPRDPDKCPKHLFITDFKDGSFCVVAQKLVPVSVAVDDILFQEKIDETLCAIEDVLGLDADSLSSTSGYAGLSDDRMDYLMSEMEQTIVSMDAKN